VSKVIAASILNANLACLGEDVLQVSAAGVGSIHFDVMDHHYVPNLSFGASVCAALRDFGIATPIDVHLMVTKPMDYIEPFAKAGANMITFHPDTVADADLAIDYIKDNGMKAGLAFNPDQDVVINDEIIEKIDMLLLMSVFPGFGGQSFIEASYQKIKYARGLLDKHNSPAYLAVDGGINLDNIGQVSKSGADFFVVGSGLMSSDDYCSRIDQLTALL